ncbi:MAG: phosphatase PAP2 family protein [Pirellulaceae bacterium]
MSRSRNARRKPNLRSTSGHVSVASPTTSIANSHVLPWTYARVILLGGLVIASLAVMPLDIEISRFLGTENLPGDAVSALKMTEFFAHGFGITLILAAVFALDPSRRYALIPVIVAQLLASLVVHVVKVNVVRWRPADFFNLSEPATSSFVSWLGWLNPDSNQSWNLMSVTQSYPSGHSAAVVALALSLTWLYPHGRVLFLVMAILGCLQRIIFHAHWPSDVLMGATIGYLVAMSVLNSRFAQRMNSRQT